MVVPTQLMTKGELIKMIEYCEEQLPNMATEEAKKNLQEAITTYRNLLKYTPEGDNYEL